MQPCSHADPLNTFALLKDSSDSRLSTHNSFSQSSLVMQNDRICFGLGMYVKTEVL